VILTANFNVLKNLRFLFWLLHSWAQNFWTREIGIPYCVQRKIQISTNWTR